ncbi:hypothetical protein [Prescottella sp. R16]|nr:hypothetical protein [Prescottella sp. R16]
MGSIDADSMAQLGKIQPVIAASGGALVGIGSILGLVLAISKFAAPAA